MRWGGAASVSCEGALFTGSSGNLAASVDFTLDGPNLKVVLTNTSSSDVLVPADVLTAVFFSTLGNTAFGSVSAILTAGSTVIYDPDGQPADGVVGGEWAFGNALSGAPLGANSGISSSGFGIFGDATFPGPSLQNPDAVDGLQYGITSAGDNSATGNGGITGTDGLIKNSVTFLLSGVPVGFNPASITKVSFQYGTAVGDPDEPNIPGDPFTPGGGLGTAPEAATLIIWSVLGTIALGFGCLRRHRQAV